MVTASRHGTAIPITYKWQCNNGAGLVDIVEAHTAPFRIPRRG